MGHISFNYFKQVLNVVTQLGIAESDCLKAAGLNGMPTGGRLDVDIISKILGLAAKRLNEPLIGIRCALKYPILQYTRPAEFLKFCENIRQAADYYKTYSSLFHTLGTPSGIIYESQTHQIIWSPNFELARINDYCLHIDFILANYVTSINWLVWQIPNAVQQINLKHVPPVPVQEYSDLLGCDVKYGQEEYAIILKDGVKDSPFSMSDPIELAKIKIKFDIALNELLADESLIARVQIQIRHALENGALNKAQIAKAIDMPERNMTRALAGKGTSYKELKNNVLKDLAKVKINQGQSLAEVAYALGYNDQPAFTRAYKKWYGHPPGKDKPAQ